MDELPTKLAQFLGSSYRIGRELGGGGMSRVFLAVEAALERDVVIKVLPPEMAMGVSTERFRREMQTVARLQHPHIVPVLSTGMTDDLVYYVMPFIKGESLRARLDRESVMPIEESARILREVADALSVAHAQGIVHRDIKPDNVLLSNGHAMVTDFGVAKALGTDDSSTGITSVGVAMGTPVYMAPEQAMADPQLDHRADLYALGVMAYEMIAGEPPFTSTSPQALIAAHITREPLALHNHRLTVPASLDEMVMRCLAKRPADRYQHAADLLPILDAVAHRSTTLAPTAPQLSAAPTSVPSLPVFVRPAGLVLLVAVVAWALRSALGLPDWLVFGTVGVALVSIPLVWRALRRRERRQPAATTPTSTRGKLVTAGAIALLGMGAASGAFVGLRAAGIGPFETLLSAGTIAERDRILVADFGNTTPDTLLGIALTEALTIDLSQSKVVRLMSPADVRDGLARMKRDVTTKLAPDVATELAAREGVKVIVAGDVAPFASGFTLSARVLDAQGATLYASRTTAANANELIPALEVVSRKIREAIGESLRSIRATQSLEQVSTSSLEALRLYSRAARSQRDGEDVDRLPMLRQAVALDSNFAMAWRAIYTDLNNLRGDPSLRLDAAERVNRNIDRLPAREALMAEALYANIQGDMERSVELYRRVVASWPDDRQARNGIGLYLRALGRYEEAEQALASMITDSTASSSSMYNLVTTQIPLSRFTEAEQSVAFMNERYPKSPTRLQAAYFLATSTNKFSRALAVADTLSRSDGAGYRYWGHLYAAEVHMLRGQIAAGDRSTRGAIQAQRDQRNLGGALREELWATWIDLQLRGDTAALRARVDAALAATPLDSLPLASRPWGEVVRLRSGLGQPSEARAVVAKYDQLMPELWRKDDASMERGLAQLALAEGKAKDAIPLARNGAQGCGGCTGDLIGQAFEKLGLVDSAIVAYESALRPPTYGSGFQNWRPAVIPRVLFRLGELYQQQGKRQLARDRFAQFVDLWQQADAPLQVGVRSARDRLKALAGEP